MTPLLLSPEAAIIDPQQEGPAAQVDTPRLIITYDENNNEIGRKVAAGGDTEGTVYIVQALPGTPVKIGFTTKPDIRERILGLQTGNPYPLRLLASTKARLRDERAIHIALGAERLTGEWFEWSDRTIAFVEQLWIHGIKAAIESVQELRAPVVPKGWDVLWVSESAIHAVFSLRRTDTISKARKTGGGPEFRLLERSGRPARYYRLDHLKQWFVANNIAHRVRPDYWARHVLDASQGIDE